MKVARDVVEKIQSFHEQYFTAKDTERYVMDKLSNPNEEGDVLMKRYSNKFKFSYKKLRYWCDKSNISVSFDELNEVYDFKEKNINSNPRDSYDQMQKLIYCFRNPNQILNHLQDYKE